jgi:hypothetical protein
MSEADDKTKWQGDWELVETGGTTLHQFRQRVPGGWLVMCAMNETASMTFLPDAAYVWNPPIKQSRKKGFSST